MALVLRTRSVPDIAKRTVNVRAVPVGDHETRGTGYLCEVPSRPQPPSPQRLINYKGEKNTFSVEKPGKQE